MHLEQSFRNEIPHLSLSLSSFSAFQLFVECQEVLDGLVSPNEGHAGLALTEIKKEIECEAGENNFTALLQKFLRGV